MYDMLIEDEPLRIGVIASTDEESMLRHLFPKAAWYHYEDVKEFLRWGEQDRLEILVIDAAQAEREAVDSLRGRYPILVLLAPGSDPCWWMEAEGIPVLRKPVDPLRFMNYLATQEETIWLRRLFHEVAAAFAMDAEK